MNPKFVAFFQRLKAFSSPLFCCIRTNTDPRSNLKKTDSNNAIIRLDRTKFERSIRKNHSRKRNKRKSSMLSTQHTDIGPTLSQKQHDAAIKIQKVYRGLCGRKKRKEYWKEAVQVAANYWTNYVYAMNLEKEKLRIAAKVRRQVNKNEYYEVSRLF